MGAWGAGLYQDDVTCDVSEEYKNRLRIGQTNIEATEALLEDASGFLDDEDDESLFWFALAETQWKYGRLLPEVKEKAIEKIHSGEDLKRWEENPNLYKKRKKVLEELEKKLNSPQPPEKKVSKLVLTKPIWEAGDVLLYQIHNATQKPNESLENHKWYGKYVLLKVLGTTKFNIGSLPMKYYFHEMNVVGIYNWIGNEKPNPSIIEKLNLKFSFDDISTKRTLDFTKNELKRLNFEKIAKDKKYQNEHNCLINANGIILPNINTINNSFIRVLESLEIEGKLIDETTKQ